MWITQFYLQITPCLPLRPSRRTSSSFGWYSLYRPKEGRRLSRPVWLVTYRNKVPPPEPKVCDNVNMPNRVFVSTGATLPLTDICAISQQNVNVHNVRLSRIGVEYTICLANIQGGAENHYLQASVCQRGARGTKVVCRHVSAGIFNDRFITKSRGNRISTSRRRRADKPARRAASRPPNVWYTNVDAQCHKLATDDRHQFITLNVHLR